MRSSRLPLMISALVRKTVETPLFCSSIFFFPVFDTEYSVLVFQGKEVFFHLIPYLFLPSKMEKGFWWLKFEYPNREV